MSSWPRSTPACASPATSPLSQAMPTGPPPPSTSAREVMAAPLLGSLNGASARADVLSTDRGVGRWILGGDPLAAHELTAVFGDELRALRGQLNLPVADHALAQERAGVLLARFSAGHGLEGRRRDGLLDEHRLGGRAEEPEELGGHGHRVCVLVGV